MTTYKEFLNEKLNNFYIFVENLNIKDQELKNKYLSFINTLKKLSFYNLILLIKNNLIPIYEKYNIDGCLSYLNKEYQLYLNMINKTDVEKFARYINLLIDIAYDIKDIN